MRELIIALPVLMIITEKTEKELREKFREEIGIKRIRPFGTIKSILFGTSAWFVELSGSTLEKLYEAFEFSLQNGSTYAMMSNSKK